MLLLLLLLVLFSPLLLPLVYVLDGVVPSADVLVTGWTSFPVVAAVVESDNNVDVDDEIDVVVSSVAVVTVVVKTTIVEVFIVCSAVVVDVAVVMLVVGSGGIKHFQSPSQLASIELTAPSISKQVLSTRLC